MKNGNKTAEYGKQLIKELSKKLSNEYGKGFNETNLRKVRQFYLCFQKWDTMCLKLSWTYYWLIIKVENENARMFYMI